MRVDQVEKTLGRVHAWERAATDSDRDGVVNMIDCAPKNPKKQGFIHTMVQKYKARKKAEKTGKEAVKSGEITSERDIEEKYRGDSPAGKAARRQLTKQRAEKAYEAERERVQIQKAKKRARSGGYMGQMVSSIDRITAPSPGKRLTRAKRRKKTRKRRTYKKQPSLNITSGYKFI